MTALKLTIITALGLLVIGGVIVLVAIFTKWERHIMADTCKEWTQEDIEYAAYMLYMKRISASELAAQDAVGTGAEEIIGQVNDNEIYSEQMALEDWLAAKEQLGIV